MKRVFADLHLRINIKDEKNIRYFIDRAKRFGYSQISFPFNTQLEEGQLNGLKKSCTHAGIDFVARADFRPKNQQDLMKFLRKFRRKLEVICILTDNKEIARQAAKDRRVDILNFPSLDYHKRFFDRAEAELASQSQTAFEIDVKSLLVLEGPSRVRLLSCLRREVAIAREFKV
ncbi:MAG: RNase P subunit p30 family protein, partial [Candidatus Bathyarchaeia archaeon]